VRISVGMVGARVDRCAASSGEFVANDYHVLSRNRSFVSLTCTAENWGNASTVPVRSLLLPFITQYSAR